MSSEMPELGSTISLISKANIRYEGKLFTFDAHECTIALSNVRSYGTEDRDAEFHVDPQKEIYDYILFRASDIQKIKVVNEGTVHDDPAIVHLSVPSSHASAYQPQGFSHPVLGHVGHGLPHYPYIGMGALTGLPSGVAPGMTLHHDPHSLPKQPSELVIPVQVPEHPTNKDQDFITGSRSTTPSLISRKSPTMDQGVQVNQLPLTALKEPKKTQRTSPPVAQSRQMPPLPRDGPINRSSINQQQYHTLPQREPPKEQREPRERERDQSVRDQVASQTTQRSVTQQQRGAWVNRGMRRGRGRGAMSGGGFNRLTGTGQQPGTANKPKNTLKFENDFDFEQANTAFEELRSQLAKTKIADSEPVIAGDGKVNGDSEKKDDSGNETGAGEGETEEEPEVYYDKTKSFFDNISCEAVERSKGHSQRTDWRTERKLNSETFGVASARRGGYRGRGYYGNRGNMYRGGKFRGGFRGQGGSRGGGRVTNPSAPATVMGNPQTRASAQSK